MVLFYSFETIFFWPQFCNPPASACLVLRLEVCIVMSGYKLYFFPQNMFLNIYLEFENLNAHPQINCLDVII